MSQKLIALLLFSLALSRGKLEASGSGGSTTDCSFTVAATKDTYNLQPMNNPNLILSAVSAKSNTYWFAACSTPHSCGASACQCTSNQAVCMKGANSNWFGCGSFDLVTTTVNATDKSLQLHYDGGVPFNGVPRFTDVECKCVIAGPPTLVSAVEDGSGGYFLYISGDACCPIVGGMGGGWLVVIIVVSVFAGYCLVGAVVQKFVRHAEGIDMVPNVEFWQALPGLVKDGAHFTKDKFFTVIGRTPA